MLYVTVVFVATLYIVTALDHFQWSGLPTGISGFLHAHVQTDYENSALELLSAASWLVATILFGRASAGEFRRGGMTIKALWLGSFMLLAAAALGEEISWGTHWIGRGSLSDPINSPFSLHNMETALVKMVYVANPLFYLTLALIWVGLPFLKTHAKVGRKPALARMPVPAGATQAFFLAHLTIYLVLDQLVFDVGFVFEASVSLHAVTVALDMQYDGVQATRSR